ncbi:MAG: capsule biosynthesis protein [Dehalococcoidia bacterium]|nr:MAG: capsule biosynthesis protein [Dehalococcoidia bacterium]
MNLLEPLSHIKRSVFSRLGIKSEVSIWASLIRSESAYWQAAKQTARAGQRVLIATSMGGYQRGALVESALAAALTLRGASVDVLLCDSFLPACQLTDFAVTPPEQLVRQTPQKRCDSCQWEGKKLFKPLGLPIHWYGQLVTAEEADEARRIAASIPPEQIGEFRLNNLAVGEHALAGDLRYFARSDLENSPTSEVVLRRYLEASVLTVYSLQNLLKRTRYDVACFNHGIYVPQGLIGEVCRQNGVRVVNWCSAYRKQCFIFSHGDTYHHTMVSEPVAEWENIPWNSETEKEILEYLKSRWQGTQDWIWFHDRPQENTDEIQRETGIDFNRPTVAMLTSVMWDARLHYASNAFPSMLDWVLQTIANFAKRPGLQLVIRVHPAEVRGFNPSRQPLVAEIKREFPVLPPNVFVIPPESQISSYAVVSKCNAAIIYNTKMGIEVSSMGIPVIVAGEAWIRNKGFSIDASSPSAYFRILEELPFATGLSAEKLERARKYAYHFFSRRMIPMPFITPGKGIYFGLGISSIKDLSRGHYPGLDVICDGILNGADFTYDPVTEASQ